MQDRVKLKREVERFDVRLGQVLWQEGEAVPAERGIQHLVGTIPCKVDQKSSAAS